MEKQPQLLSQVTKENNNREERDRRGDEEEEFYEKIEAPKFVDFSKLDHYRPDDRYWFCLRVGCDQKHEEEIDPEAISKNFVLRVMAARSPNIRLRKALNRKASSMNEKYPLSAPPKPSRPRISRLAVISSLSQRMADSKGKVKPLPKPSSTPIAKGKQVAAKYMTTPRNKRCLPNENSFRTVQNPKPSKVAVPKNRVVAKALVFNSPKKAISIKTSSELHTPLTKICAGMKRLGIASQRKGELGYSNKSTKDVRGNPNKLLPANPSRRQLSACKDKSKGVELFRPPTCKNQETKPLRFIKRKSKGNSKKPFNALPKEMVEKDSSNVGIDRKSSDGSELCISRINTSGSFHSDRVPSDASGGEINSSNSEEGRLGENDFSKLQAPIQEANGNSEGIDQEEKTKPSSVKVRSPEDHRTESQTSEGVGHEEEEAMDCDDKENALASYSNRDLDHNKNYSGRKKIGKQETAKIMKKVAQTHAKNLKEVLTVGDTGTQGVKYRKPKPTNPKPFRLRTDERGILREANLEKTIQSLVPQKETTTMFPGGILQKRHGNDIQRNEKCLEQNKCNPDIHESRGKESDESFCKDDGDGANKSRNTNLWTPERLVRPRMDASISQKHSNSTQRKSKPIMARLDCDMGDLSQKSENSLRKTKSSSMRGQFIRSKGVASTQKARASYLTHVKQLSVIKEASPTASRLNAVGEPLHNNNGLANKATPPASSRSLSRGKRHATIPKEPNFQSLHVPKSCTRNVS